jgi:hypothetical protein
MTTANAIIEAEIAAALDACPVPDTAPAPVLTVTGTRHLAHAYDVSGLAVASVAAAARELAFVSGARQVAISRPLVERWFDMTVRPHGWTIPDPWDPIAGVYAARDTFVRLHTNAPAHRAAALQVLGCAPTKEAVARAVAGWAAEDLETAIVAAGGVAAAFRSRAQWLAHPQGQAVSASPLIRWRLTPGAAPAIAHPAHPRADRPAPAALDGVKVLDCTRVLAGPVATRFLAGFGAHVLRIDPPTWREDALEAEITLGKTCAGLDLNSPPDRATFERLIREADVFVHGYRPGALDALGFSLAHRRALNPRLIDVSLSAYGTTGPWGTRRGFDSIVQIQSGLAHEGLRAAARAQGTDPDALDPGTDAPLKPVPLPVQALDHATGYLMAATVLRALRLASHTGTIATAELSLARTAELLAAGGVMGDAGASGVAEAEWVAETTHWGMAERVAFPVTVDGAGAKWGKRAGPFRAGVVGW